MNDSTAVSWDTTSTTMRTSISRRITLRLRLWTCPRRCRHRIRFLCLCLRRRRCVVIAGRFVRGRWPRGFLWGSVGASSLT